MYYIYTYIYTHISHLEYVEMDTVCKHSLIKVYYCFLTSILCNLSTYKIYIYAIILAHIIIYIYDIYLRY